MLNSKQDTETQCVEMALEVRLNTFAYELAASAAKGTCARVPRTLASSAGVAAFEYVGGGVTLESYLRGDYKTTQRPLDAAAMAPIKALCCIAARKVAALLQLGTRIEDARGARDCRLRKVSAALPPASRSSHQASRASSATATSTTAMRLQRESNSQSAAPARAACRPGDDEFASVAAGDDPREEGADRNGTSPDPTHAQRCHRDASQHRCIVCLTCSVSSGCSSHAALRM